MADLTKIQVQAILDALTPAEHDEAEARRADLNSRADGVLMKKMSVVGFWRLHQRHCAGTRLWWSAHRALEAFRLASEDEGLSKTTAASLLEFGAATTPTPTDVPRELPPMRW